MPDMTREMEAGARLESAERAREVVTLASNRTLDALRGHLSPDKRAFNEGLLENLNGARAWFSRKSLKMTSALALAALFLSSCAPSVVGSAIIPDSGGAGPTVTEPSPTATVLPTETATPTPEAPKTDEHDLKPAFTEKISYKLMGVQIEGELVTDESLGVSNPPIYEVTVPQDIGAQYIARVIYAAWATNDNAGSFEDFMKLWSKVQSKDPSVPPSAIDISLWANNLNDGKGYIQERRVFRPLIEGSTPDGVTRLDKISIDLVSSKRMKNITTVNAHFDVGFGTNIDNNTLYLYLGPAFGGMQPVNSPRTLSGNMSYLSWWISNNTGKPMSISSGPTDYDLWKLLQVGGLTVK